MNTRFRKGDKTTALAGVEARRERGMLSGEGNPNWRGGERRTRYGYVEVVISPEEALRHPTARRRGRSHVITRSHRVWNESHPDDLVQPGDNVHHLNHVRDDDRPENLRKMHRSSHYSLHAEERRLPPRLCATCGEPTKRRNRQFCSLACYRKFRFG